MDISASGITSKLTNHAEALVILASTYQRFQESDRKGQLQSWFTTQAGLPNELLNDVNGFTEGGHYLMLYKLWYSNHLYATTFKLCLAAWLLDEIGIYKKYGSLGKKLIKASIISAAILPGSGGESRGGSSLNSSGRPGGSTGRGFFGSTPTPGSSTTTSNVVGN